MADPATVRVERLERLDPATATAVETMAERSAVHDHHSPIGEHTFVRLVGGGPDTFGLIARLEAGDKAVGYAQATRFERNGRLPSRIGAELLVDPAHRGIGIGRALVDRLIDEAREADVERFDIWAHHADAASVGLASAYGLRDTRRLWQLAMRLAAVAPGHRRVASPVGIRLRNFEAGRDDELLVALIRDAFPEHPENAGFSREDFATRRALDWFDPSAILLAEDEASGQPLGLHWMKRDVTRREGEVYILGVTPAAQDRGVGRHLLLEGLEEMRRREIHLAYLYVDADNEAALRLYRAAGFRHEHLDTCYSLDLGCDRPRRAALSRT